MTYPVNGKSSKPPLKEPSSGRILAVEPEPFAANAPGAVVGSSVYRAVFGFELERPFKDRLKPAAERELARFRKDFRREGKSARLASDRRALVRPRAKRLGGHVPLKRFREHPSRPLELKDAP